MFDPSQGGDLTNFLTFRCYAGRAIAGKGLALGTERWFKHWAHASLVSPDLNALTDHEERVWWRLLAVGSIEVERWHVRMQLPALARMCASTPARLRTTLQTFAERGMVEMGDGEIVICNAPYWQESPDAKRQRTKRDRDKQRDLSRDSHVTDGVTVTADVTRNVTTEGRRKKEEGRSLPLLSQGERRARAEAPEAEPASEARDMRETLLQALPMKFRWEADIRDDVDQFVADFAGRFAEVTAAIAACRREREIPFPRNLRGHLPAVPGGSNDGGKRGHNGARNGRTAAAERCPCGRTRWADAGGAAGYCEQCGAQEPISTEMLARIGRLEG